jgi:2-methylcitrate dehydratase PrpD
MTLLAEALATWAAGFRPSRADLELADRALADTVAVTVAARDHPVARLAAGLPDGPRWAVTGHVLDFDDLHMPSTTHISAVCVPAALATGGGARAYLAAAGVMARLGTLLGWPHYSAGWHATCTAGAPASAAGAAVALGLPAERIATAMALAVPGAGGVQRAFGTDAKSLQVGFAVDTGLRAASLAAAGASADPAALDDWLRLVGGGASAARPPAGQPAVASGAAAPPGGLELAGPAVPDGLAIKIYPCCYALQRPIATLTELAARVDPRTVRRIVLRTPEAAVAPLIHHRPGTGLQGKFSLEYAAAAALLDGHPGLGAFTDEAVRRDQARRLTALVETDLVPGGTWLLDGELEAEVHLAGGRVLRGRQQYPPGSPARPPSARELQAKLADCVAGLDTDSAAWTWRSAADVLRKFCPPDLPDLPEPPDRREGTHG